MDRRQSDESTQRFSAYLDELASVIGHAARVGPMRDYCISAATLLAIMHLCSFRA